MRFGEVNSLVVGISDVTDNFCHGPKLYWNAVILLRDETYVLKKLESSKATTYRLLRNDCQTEGPLARNLGFDVSHRSKLSSLIAWAAAHVVDESNETLYDGIIVKESVSS